jgi:hypothetical protein
VPRRRTHPRRGLPYEQPGAVDYPFDDDRTESGDLFASDAACAIAWRAGGFEAIQVFVDPALRDRAEELCAMVESASGAQRDIDSLSETVLSYADREGLSASIHERPPGDLSEGLVAIAFTIG